MEELKAEEKILKKLMDDISEIEGAIVSSQDGLIAAKAIYDDLDLKTGDINNAAFDIAVFAASLGEKIQKAALKEVLIEYEAGFALITGQGDLILTLFLGNDARASMGLVKVNARKALRDISRCR